MAQNQNVPQYQRPTAKPSIQTVAPQASEVRSTEQAENASLLAALALRYHVDQKKLYKALVNCCFFVDEKPVTTEELIGLAVICLVYNLNPFLKHVHAIRNRNGIVQPLISVDGWLYLLLNNPKFNGMRCDFSEKETTIGKACTKAPEYCEVTIFRKDCDHPIVHREYLEECYQENYNWRRQPRRMLKHKTTIQATRYAFGVSGSFDETSFAESEVYGASENGAIHQVKQMPTSNVAKPVAEATNQPASIPTLPSREDILKNVQTVVAKNANVDWKGFLAQKVPMEQYGELVAWIDENLNAEKQIPVEKTAKDNSKTVEVVEDIPDADDPTVAAGFFS